MTNSMWWYLTRAAALTAWAFLTLTMVWGTLISTRWIQRARARRWLGDLHPFLGSIGLAALALHIVSVIMDSQSHLGWTQAIVPFTASWNRLGVALGVLALWILAAVEVTSLLRRRLAKRTWRGVHLTSYVAAWLMAIHAVTTGTDLKLPVVAWGSLAIVAVTTVLTVRRVLRRPATTPLPASPRPESLVPESLVANQPLPASPRPESLASESLLSGGLTR